VSDWAVGDKAVCIREPQDKRNHASKGAIYTVAEVVLGGSGLTFREIPHPNAIGYKAINFRKILPDKHEACETEFVDLLKRIKRPVSA
jgi:hypothetical protein